MSKQTKTWTVVGGLAALVVIGLLIWAFVASGKDANQEALNERYDQAATEVTVSAEGLAESLNALSALDPDGAVFASGMEALSGALDGEVPVLSSDVLDQAYLERLDSDGTTHTFEAESGETATIEGRPLLDIADELGLLADAESQPGKPALQFPARPKVVTQEDIDALGQVASNLDAQRQAVDAEVASLLWARS